MHRHFTRVTLASTAVAIVAIAGGVTYAVADIGGGGMINGCYKSQNGQLRLIDPAAASCDPSEKAISWRQTGPQGRPGPQGATGPHGVTGPQGASGVSNVYSVDDLFPQVLSVPDAGGPISRINLPPGKFLLFASASFNNPGAAEALVECHIEGPGGRGAASDFGSRYATLGGTANGLYYDAATIAFQTTVLPQTSTSYDLQCSDYGGQVAVSSLIHPNLTAIEFDSLYSLPAS